MSVNKTYYSISEVSKLLGIEQHTIRFWDSKIENLSKKSEKGKTRFFTQHHIKKLSLLNNLLKGNSSLELADKIISKQKNINSFFDFKKKSISDQNNIKNYNEIKKIKRVVDNLKKLLK